VSLVYGSDAHRPGDIASTVFVEDVVARLGGWTCSKDRFCDGEHCYEDDGERFAFRVEQHRPLR